MSRTTVLTLSLLTAGLLAAAPASFAETSGTSATKLAKAAPRKATAPAAQTESHAIASDVTEPVSATQLQIADRVLTGTAQCEFNQTVSVDAMKDKPGHFKVGFNKASYVMTPQETSTGAVRLEDRRNGIVWLQIPSKSMMMNQKVGQRMVDGCMHAEQRASAGAVRSASSH